MNIVLIKSHTATTLLQLSQVHNSKIPSIQQGHLCFNLQTGESIYIYEHSQFLQFKTIYTEFTRCWRSTNTHFNDGGFSPTTRSYNIFPTCRWAGVVSEVN